MDLNDRDTGTETPDRSAKFKIFVPMVKAMRDHDDLVLSGVASSTVTDRHGDEMRESALVDMLAAAQDNLTIFLNHQYRVPEDVAGSVRQAHMNRDATGLVDLIFDRISVNKVNQRAVEAFESIEAGTKLGLSIGARIPEGGARYDKKLNGWVIEHVDLLETSIVSIPANPRSWIDYAVKAMSGHYPEQFQNVVKAHGFEGLSKDISQWVDEAADLDPEGVEPELRAGIGSGLTGEEIQLAADEVATIHAEGAVTVQRLEEIEDAVGFVAPQILTPLTNSENGTANFDVLTIVPEIVEAKKPAEHTHPHAHEHDHEHTHGYAGETQTVHSHDHAHRHSHAHGEDHEHEDTMNDYEHDHWHAGSTDDEHGHTKDADGLVAVRLTEDGVLLEAVVHEHLTIEGADPAIEDGSDAVDGTTAQGAPQSTPETEVTASDEPADQENLLAEAIRLIEPSFVASISSASDLIKALSNEVGVVRADLIEAERQRDEALAMVDKVLGGTEEVLAQLSALPAGRRAVAQKVNEEFESFKGILNEDVMSILRSK